MYNHSHPYPPKMPFSVEPRVNQCVRGNSPKQVEIAAKFGIRSLQALAILNKKLTTTRFGKAAFAPLYAGSTVEYLRRNDDLLVALVICASTAAACWGAS